MKKVLTFLGCLLPFAVFLCVQGYVATMYSACVQILMKYFHVSLKGIITEQQFTGVLTTYMLFLCTLSTSIVGALWYGLGYAKRYEVNIRKSAKVKDFGYIIGIAFSFIFVTNILVAFIVAFSPSSMDKYEQLMDSAGMGSQIITFITAAFIAPIGEECFYRGVVQRKAEKIMPFLWANILQAALFGIMHMNLIQGTYAFVLGLLIGYVHHKYQSIVMPIVLHTSYNILGQTLPLLASKLGTLPLFFITIGSVVLLVVLMKRVSKVSVAPKQQEWVSVS